MRNSFFARSLCYSLSLILAFSILFCHISSAAGVSTVYRPATLHYGVVTADGLPDNGIAMPSYPNNENKTITINYTADTLGLLICTSFDAPNIFISNETYMFKLAVTCPQPTVVKPNAAHAELYKTINNAPAQNFNWSGRTRIYEEQGVVYDAAFDSNQTLTVTLSNIPWSIVKSYATWGMYLPKALLYSSNSAVPVIVNAMYFGAESGFSEDRFAQQVSDSLDNIQSTLQNNGDKIDAVGGKVDAVGGKIDDVGNKIDDLPQKELDEAQKGGDASSDDASNAANTLPDEPDSFWDAIRDLWNMIQSQDTISEIPLPSGIVDVCGLDLDIWAGESSVDLSPWLNNPKIAQILSIVRALSTLAMAAVGVHWLKAAKSWIFDDDVPVSNIPDIPMLPKGD